MSAEGTLDSTGEVAHICNDRCGDGIHFFPAVESWEINDMERQSMTIWCPTLGAQIRTYADADYLVLAIQPEMPISKEDGKPYMVPPADVEKLRQLLNEAHARRAAAAERKARGLL